MSVKVVLLIFALVSVSLGQEITPGQCPEVTAVENFEMSRILGTWYEIHRYQIEDTIGVDCLKGVYSPWNETHIAIDASGKDLKTNETAVYHGSVHEQFPGENIGVVNIQIEGVPLEEILWILAVNYDSYTVSWACFYIEEADINYQFMWVHAKNRELTPDEEVIVHDVIDSFGLNSTLLYNTIQDPELCGV